MTRHTWVCLLFVAATANGCSHDWDRFEPPSAPLGAPGGTWTLTFQEECQGDAVDAAKWNTIFVAPNRTSTFRRYDWSASAVLDSNVTLADGHCLLRIAREKAEDAEYSSGTLDSTNKFEQRFGYFEARFRAARGAGINTTFQIAASDRWPPQVTVANVPGASPSEADFIVHYRNGQESAQSTEETFASPADLTADFHVYGVEWTETGFTFFVDGVKQATLTEGVSTMTLPLRLQMVAHVAGEFPPFPDAGTPFPNEVAVDWVRVWKRAP